MGSVEQMSKDLRRIGSVMNKQEAKADAGKPKLTLVPRKILTAIARVREYGCQKYGDPENKGYIYPEYEPEHADDGEPCQLRREEG